MNTKHNILSLYAEKTYVIFCPFCTEYNIRRAVERFLLWLANQSAVKMFHAGLFVVHVLLLLLSAQTILANYDLTILHTNDVHDRKEQFDSGGGMCSEEEASTGRCYGGVARTATMVKDIKAQVDNVLFLDAGDQFQGTNWFVHYQGIATAYFMNRLGYDAQVGIKLMMVTIQCTITANFPHEIISPNSK